MARHLQQVHANEREVASTLMHPKGSKARTVSLQSIRNEGNYRHNAEVIRTGRGELVPRKRPTMKTQRSDFLHCLFCHGLFMRENVWRYHKTCPMKPKNSSTTPGKTRVQKMCAFMEPIPSHINEKLWTLLSTMSQDEITHTVKNDERILQLGQQHLNKSGSNPKRYENIRQKMREVGRLLITARKMTAVKDIKDLIDAKKYQTVVKAVKETCGYDSRTETYKIKGLALKLGHSLKKVAKLMESNGRMSGNYEMVAQAVDFQKVHETKWCDYISSTALRNLHEAKWNTPLILPFTEDIQKLHSYLDSKNDEYHKLLSEEPSDVRWSCLAQTCLASVILFNRREGEVSSMPL
ncbi:uncharacterized protein LOC121700265 [Alosa sapidissima]|uniref:uncharacterized protein LOC121700265 n=1 Tax=Alosa sapidissima TaxID=34773 RepID=UPI001C096160|nr:uncharacterized protein LOC121700265 [Alosa sapidissima]